MLKYLIPLRNLFEAELFYHSCTERDIIWNIQPIRGMACELIIYRALSITTCDKFTENGPIWVWETMNENLLNLNPAPSHLIPMNVTGKPEVVSLCQLYNRMI